MNDNFAQWLENQTMNEPRPRWHGVMVRSSDIPVAQSRWCTEQFGTRFDFLNKVEGCWDVLWAGQGEWRFRFNNEADAVCFRLTWSQ